MWLCLLALQLSVAAISPQEMDPFDAALGAVAFTTPFKGTCGVDPENSVYNVYQSEATRTCTVACPSALQNYTEKPQHVQSEYVIEGSYTFMEEGCNVPERGMENEYHDAQSAQCYFFHNTRTAFNRETHSMWINPKLNGRQGVLVNPTINGNDLYGITSDGRLAVVTVDGSGRQNTRHVYKDVYIPDNQWTHLAVQVDNQAGSERSLFVNGEFVPPVISDVLEIGLGLRRKKRSSGVIFQETQYSVGIQMFAFGRGDFVEPEPLEVDACLAIGYSASVVNICSVSKMDGFFEYYMDIEGSSPQCQEMENQADIQSSVFSGDFGGSCQYKPELITLFACSAFLPTYIFSVHGSIRSPCKSLCKEVFSNCPDLDIPGVNTNCQDYPDDNCTDADFLTQRFGLYHGQIRDYVIHNEILTNREIELLADPDLGSLPPAHGLPECLCPPDRPAFSAVYGDSTCVKNVDINSETQSMANMAVPRLEFPPQYYHLPEFAVDGDPDTAWVSLPGLEEVALDIVFHQAIQVTGVTIHLSPPLAPLDSGDSPLVIELLSAGLYKTVAYVSPACEAVNFTSSFGITCIQMQLFDESPNQLYNVSLLAGKERWYTHNSTDVELLSFLRAESLRLSFNGFAPAPPQSQYHMVSDLSVTYRPLAAPVLCECYEDGTDPNRECNDVTGQCPCLPDNGNQQEAGLKCEPYVTSMVPDYGPESGGTLLDIRGGYFGEEEVAVQGIVGNLVVKLHLASNSPGRIQVITFPINATTTPELLQKPLEIIITLSNGHVIETGVTFQYMEDPVIEDIFPLESFIKGGIPQTVIGQDLDSVFQPLMHVVMILQGVTYFSTPNFTLCTVLSDTMMTCPTPSFESAPVLTRKRRDLADTPLVNQPQVAAGDSLSTIVERIRRQTGRVTTSALNRDGFQEFHISFYLDGVPTYRNVTAALGEDKGTIYIFRDPDIEARSEEVLIFRPYQGDDTLEVSGQRMDYGCELKDYNVTIGNSMCENQELLTNLLQCRPPSTPPDLGEFAKDGAHRVLCNVGNIKVHLGYMEYRTGLLDEPWFVAVIVSLCVVLAIILVCLAIFFILWKYYGENPYKHIKQRRQKQRMNSYVAEPHEAHPLQPREVNLMAELKKHEPVLHENVLKCRIQPDRMELGKRIGKGNFGMVHDALYNSPQGQIRVAVKTLKGGSDSQKEFTEFLQEATIMQDFDHKNVLTLHGVVIKDNTPYVLLPLMDKGDMKTYVSDPQNHFSVGELIGYGAQIAEGMAYLASLKFVHRDLAARNCMINSEKLVKIADFGLARDIYEKDYYAVQDKKKPLPVKWMAVECLDSYKFSTKSDVWSFGVTLWELLMRGVKPYSHIDNMDMKRYLLMGKRLDKPAYCPENVFELMFECWAPDPADRPEFANIQTRLEKFLDLASDFESNPLYEGRGDSTDAGDRPNNYLEMMGMAPGFAPGAGSGAEADDTYRGYLQLDTGVPADIPSAALLNNNPSVPVYGGERGPGRKEQVSDRYSKDPTLMGLDETAAPRDRLRSSEGYMDPVSAEAAQYSGLQGRSATDNPQYTDLKGVKQGAPQATSPTSPGAYLQPVSFTKKAGKEDVTIGN